MSLLHIASSYGASVGLFWYIQREGTCFGTAWYGTVRYSTVQYGTVQYSAVQYVQYVQYEHYAQYVQYVQYVKIVRYLRYVRYVWLYNMHSTYSMYRSCSMYNRYSMYSMYSMYSIYVCTSKYIQNVDKYNEYLRKTDFLGKGMSLYKKQKNAASLKRRKQGLGSPIRIEMQLILIKMN